MSLPPGFLDELKTRTSLSQVVGRKVMWDQRKSNQAKGDLWAPCPFHQEKSASFHVDDRKGYYYCFGCHAKGDALSFVRETENVGFMEAVEILAQEAGLPMPARDPRAQEKSDRMSELAKANEAALRFFRMQLKTGAASAARAYLAKRGLTEPVQDRFELGFAPDGWQGLWDHLKGQGIAPDLILEAGLARPSNKGREPYDTFRNRIIFPIRDPRGRAIAFGGRAMDPNDNAKYLNSPDSPLFDKGRTLYNHGPSREAAGKGQRLIVAEGYMDVIALSEAGFTAAVAPLGTAVTEHQLAHLWRISDEPIIALDGDKAGLNAAYRVIDLALPLLEAGKSLRFALMPEGKDPDDLLRADGPEAVAAVLDGALPMVKLLWKRETEGRVFDSPERKAALDKALRDKLKLIRDASLRGHYGQDIKDLRYDLFRGGRPDTRAGQGGGGRARGPWRPKGAPLPPQPVTKASLLVAAGDEAQTRLRESVILAAVLTCPALIEEFEGDLEAMTCSDPDHASLRDAFLRHAPKDAPSAREVAEAAIGPGGVESLLAARHVAVVPCIRRSGDTSMARMTVAEEFAKLEAARGLEAEIREAVEDFEALPEEHLTWRLGEAAETRNRALRAQQGEDADFDTGANGAHIDRDERKLLDAMIETIDFARKRR
ncbi:DNA primase [Litorisediminicola beolgyonensis]|uniref:DNA primase n=1 Tax=Litorisediminicola beolgyonensis TaxID=1173614 RepID=A0ABW3ZJ60_9RHOB